jgi:hypothetical protein
MFFSLKRQRFRRSGKAPILRINVSFRRSWKPPVSRTKAISDPNTIYCHTVLQQNDKNKKQDSTTITLSESNITILYTYNDSNQSKVLWYYRPITECLNSQAQSSQPDTSHVVYHCARFHYISKI